MARRTTIDDVAREAGVSKTTVSMVMNGLADDARIRADTCARVRLTAERLGYTPSRAAQMLRRGRTMVIALLVQSLANPLLVDLAVAARAAAAQRGCEVAIVDAPDEEAEVAALRRLHAERVDGVIVAAGRHYGRGAALRELRALVDRGLPAVMLIDRGPDPSIPSIRADIEVGSYAAVRHLLALGHRRIALLVREAPSAPLSALRLASEPSSLGDRYRGYRRALDDGGVAFDLRWLIQGAYGLSGGFTMARDLLSLDPHPTAAFVYGDLAAIGLMRGLEDAGVQVPADVAVVGFGGIELAQYTRPALTTVLVPEAEMAAMGVEALFALIRGDRPDPVERVVETHLVVRESCGGSPATTRLVWSDFAP